VISVENLTKRYVNKIAIDDMSFQVEKGEILGFLGPNGAGKTSTMRVITGYMPASGGTVKVDGFDVADQPLEVRRRIGYLPENPPLYPEMSVLGYLQFVAKLKGVSSSGLRDEIQRVMEKVNIVDVQTRIISKLSKGYKQRVGIAQAMLNDPPVLILDEPTIGLDPKQIHEVRELVKSLAGSHTVVLSTHILPEVEQTCHRVIIIDRGKIVAVDTPQNLRSQIQGTAQVFVEVDGPDADVLATLQGIPGVQGVRHASDGAARNRYQIDSESGRDVRTEIARAIVNKGWGLLELHAENMSLEDIFIKLTTAEETSTSGASAS